MNLQRIRRKNWLKNTKAGAATVSAAWISVFVVRTSNVEVPDLETVNFRVLSRTDKYEIREIEPYFVAETTMPGETGFDFYGASNSFNVLAEYMFGKNTIKDTMEMTTPVVTRKVQSVGEKMEMTIPVITRKVIKENMERGFRNTNMKPLNHSTYLRLQLLCKQIYDSDEKLSVLNDLSLTDLNSFIPELRSQESCFAALLSNRT